jgi:hypothetical protein
LPKTEARTTLAGRREDALLRKKVKVLQDGMGKANASRPGAGGAQGDTGRADALDLAELSAARSIVSDLRQLHRKTQAALMEALLPGEQPHVVIHGAGGSAIIGTGERALVVKMGARSGAALGARAKAFEFESVIGVRIDEDTEPAVVAVDAPVKIASCRVYWVDSRDNPWKARNAIPVDPPAGAAAAGVDALRGLLEAYRERHPPAGTAPSPEAAPRRTGAERPSRIVKALPPEDERAGVVSPLPVIGERCPECRAELRPGWRYCPGCGAPSQSASAPRTS